MPGIFNLSFWFNFSPDPLLPKSFGFLELVFLVLVLLSITAKITGIVKKSDYLLAHGAKKISGPFFWMGIAGLFLLVMDYERVTFLSARFWYAIWGLGFVAWMALTSKKVLRDLPERKKTIDERKKLEKWLPRKNK